MIIGCTDYGANARCVVSPDTTNGWLLHRRIAGKCALRVPTAVPTRTVFLEIAGEEDVMNFADAVQVMGSSMVFAGVTSLHVVKDMQSVLASAQGLPHAHVEPRHVTISRAAIHFEARDTS